MTIEEETAIDKYTSYYKNKCEVCAQKPPSKARTIYMVSK